MWYHVQDNQKSTQLTIQDLNYGPLCYQSDVLTSDQAFSSNPNVNWKIIPQKIQS